VKWLFCGDAAEVGTGIWVVTALVDRRRSPAPTSPTPAPQSRLDFRSAPIRSAPIRSATIRAVNSRRAMLELQEFADGSSTPVCDPVHRNATVGSG
jgi:hypothetical protein